MDVQTFTPGRDQPFGLSPDQSLKPAQDLPFSTARELANAIRQRWVSASEVIDAYLAQIARFNPSLNAIVTLDEEGARRRAREADEALARGEIWGPLHGVPITIKDSLETAGLRTTAGALALEEYVPSTDAPPVARLREAGGIIIGKTNVPPMCADSLQTNNPIFGRTNNPWDLTRVPGGSTGGGAVAVAAGLTALELGSDGAGSLRVPAHFCGICSLKPTEHRVPTTGHLVNKPSAPHGVRHMMVVGPMARSLDDLMLALRLISGPDGFQWEVPPLPLEIPPRVPLNKLRIAWTDNFGDVPVTYETSSMLAKLGDDLQHLGCFTRQSVPEDFDFTVAWETMGEMMQTEVGSTMSPEEEDQEAKWVIATSANGTCSAVTRGRARSVNASMRQYTSTLSRRDMLISSLERFFASWDVLICPVAVAPAFPHHKRGLPILVNNQKLSYTAAGTSYCNPFNLTGHPSVVVPITLSSEGLPIGVQIVGRRWSEMKLLTIAKQITEIYGSFPRPPGY